MSYLTQGRLDAYAAVVAKLTRVLDMRRQERETAQAMVSAVTVGVKEFDPNQPRDEIGRWTDTGIGGASGLDRNNIFHASVFKHAAELGIPTDVIRVSKSPPQREGMPNGWEVAATYNRADGTIILYPKSSLTADIQRSTLAHENIHRLWSEHNGLQAVIDSIKAKFGKSPIQVLSESDGLTDYSRWHWGTGDIALAIEETLAEVAALIANGKRSEIPDPWLVAYDAIKATQP